MLEERLQEKILNTIDEIAEYLLDFKGDVWDEKLQAMLDADDTTLFDEDFDEIFDDDDE